MDRRRRFLLELDVRVERFSVGAEKEQLDLSEATLTLADHNLMNLRERSSDVREVARSDQRALANGGRHHQVNGCHETTTELGRVAVDHPLVCATRERLEVKELAADRLDPRKPCRVLDVREDAERRREIGRAEQVRGGRVRPLRRLLLVSPRPETLAVARVVAVAARFFAVFGAVFRRSSRAVGVREINAAR